MESRQSSEDLGHSFRENGVSSPSDDADDNNHDESSVSSSSYASTDDGGFDHQNVSSRTQEAQAPRPSDLNEWDPASWGIVATQPPVAVRDNALQSISTSISDDLSHKDKIQARQFSALMRTTPRKRTQATAQDEARRPNPQHMHQPPPHMHQPPPHMHPPPPPQHMQPPPRLPGSETGDDLPEFFTLGGDEEPVRPSKIPMDLSHAQRKPSKRRRLEMSPKAVALREELQNLDAQELENLFEHFGQGANTGSMRAPISKPFKYLILYRIAQNRDQPRDPYLNIPIAARKNSMPLYFDPPQWTKGQGGHGVLRSQLPVTNFDLYLERNKDISFIVYKTYGMHQVGSKTQVTRDRQWAAQDLNDSVVDESIQPVDEALLNAVEALLEGKDEYASILKSFGQTSELEAPYLFVFHQRYEWEKIRLSLPKSSHQQLAMLWDYILQSQGAEYAAADSKISTGKITPELLKYLFKPGQLLVQNKDDEIQGWICEGWPMAIRRGEKTQNRPTKVADSTKPEKSQSHVETNPQCEISAWHWEFDGEFQRKKATLPISIGAGTSKESGISINSMEIFPLKYASDSIFNQLRRRGRSFWKCRKRALVSYRGDEDTSDSNLVEERYMIDLKTYRILHKSDAPQDRNRQGNLSYILPKKAMESDSPPDENFEFLLPPKIKGFNLRTKKWFDLMADGISDIKWNKGAFSKVVIDRKAKDLIRALVSNQLESEKNTDLIEGKGNGLILLLHGGPGTGKTLTAESVAEIAEKPLYRVTCGDVGTKAEEVEKYLESVLYLGKLWGCVVLLDEADIFLQQRNLEDLQRNALVSVFLRVLEYYEGILVLTSNRVGTFDEAFKSRIQLALHYPALGPYQRLRIWENFFDRLDGMEGESIDLADLRDHLSDLKEEEMNGRQIRNAITTARQYAKWQDNTLTYQHLKDVIEVSGRFDKYLTKLHGGLTEGQLAEDEGLRLGGED